MEIGSLILGLFGIVLALFGAILAVVGTVLALFFRKGVQGTRT